jgi:hypothetical protein
MYKVYEYGTVELQLNLLEGQARARPKTIQLETPGKKLQYVTLAQKSDYHITIVPTPTGKMLRKLEMANPGQKPLFDYIEFLMSMYRWHILHTGVFYELKRLDPEKGDVYTIIELEFIPDYWDFYTQLRRLLTDRLCQDESLMYWLEEHRLAPPHTTLLTSAEDRKTGIGVANRQAWFEMNAQYPPADQRIFARRLHPEEVETLVSSPDSIER